MPATAKRKPKRSKGSATAASTPPASTTCAAPRASKKSTLSDKEFADVLRLERQILGDEVFLQGVAEVMGVNPRP